MRFEVETNIYNPSALARKFSSIQTNFDVTLGKIAAIISDSEIQQYLDGHTTMNTRLSSVVQDINGVHSQISAMQTEYSDGFDLVDSQLSTVDQTLNGIRAEVSTVHSEYQNLETRISSAELQIEPNAIVNTVRSSQSYKTDINAKSATYTGDYVPTTSNLPASSWTTSEMKQSHLNDTFLTSGGEVYQYISGHNGLMITFTYDSETEATRYDYVRIFYKIGETTYVLPDIGGKDISGASVFVPSNEFWLYWRSDSSVTKYGFKIASIEWTFSNTPTLVEATLPDLTPEATSGTTYPETTHPYTNNEEKFWKYSTANTSSVSPSYGWAERGNYGIKSLAERMSVAELKITDSAIVSTVTSSQFGQVVTSTLKQTAEGIHLDAKYVSWNSTYSSMTKNGQLTCTGGKIGGFTIGSSALYNGISSVNASSGTGIYLGTDGINLGGGKFKVTSSGSTTVKNLTANDYIYVNGNSNSFFKVPLNYADTYFQAGNNGLRMRVYAIATAQGLASTDYTDLRFGNLGDYATQRYCPIELTCENLNTSLEIQTNGINITDNHDSSNSYYTSYGANGVHTRDNYGKYSIIGSNLIFTSGSLTVNGSKNRLVNTDNYSDRLLYCYETTSPLFGDIGEGTIGEDGQCYVWFDPIFVETVRLSNYQVFLQSYSSSHIYVSERTNAYFIVCGEPNVHFGWEIKAKQLDFAEKRIDKYQEDVEFNDTDYGRLAKNHINNLMKGRYVA